MLTRPIALGAIFLAPDIEALQSTTASRAFVKPHQTGSLMNPLFKGLYKAPSVFAKYQCFKELMQCTSASRALCKAPRDFSEYQCFMGICKAFLQGASQNSLKHFTQGLHEAPKQRGFMKHFKVTNPSPYGCGMGSVS